MQGDIDKKIKWAVDATDAQQKAQTDLDSKIAKLQQDLKTQVVQLRCTVIDHSSNMLPILMSTISGNCLSASAH